jgi:hypothetical protein
VSLPACKLSRSMLSHIVIMCSIPGMKAHAASTSGRLPSIHKRLYRQNLFPAIGVNETWSNSLTPSTVCLAFGGLQARFRHVAYSSAPVSSRSTNRSPRQTFRVVPPKAPSQDARVLRSSEWDTLLRAAAQSIRSTIATRPESALRRECRTELKRMRTISNQEKPR